MSQIATFPLLSRQTMSLLPSPSKSPVPTTDQVVGMLAMVTADTTCVPCMNHKAVSPLVLLQSMSLVPSPLKSPIPTTDHVVDTLPRPAEDVAFAPFMSQIAK